MKEFWETQLGGSVEDGKRMKGLRVWIWVRSMAFVQTPEFSSTERVHNCVQVAKALIVRSDPFGYRMIQDLLELFKSGEGEDGGFGRQVAKQLGVIVEAEGDVLSKENHSVIRVSYPSLSIQLDQRLIDRGRCHTAVVQTKILHFLITETRRSSQSTTNCFNG